MVVKISSSVSDSTSAIKIYKTIFRDNDLRTVSVLVTVLWGQHGKTSSLHRFLKPSSFHFSPENHNSVVGGKNKQHCFLWRLTSFHMVVLFHGGSGKACFPHVRESSLLAPHQGVNTNRLESWIANLSLDII